MVPSRMFEGRKRVPSVSRRVGSVILICIIGGALGYLLQELLTTRFP